MIGKSMEDILGRLKQAGLTGDDLVRIIVEKTGPVAAVDGVKKKDEPPVAVTPLTLPEKIEASLKEEPMDPDRLCKKIGEPKDRVEAELKHLRKDGKIYNVGWEDRPDYVWRLNQETRQTEAIPVIHALLQYRPMCVQDLIRALNITPKVADGAMVDIRRAEGSAVKVVRKEGRAQYYFLDYGKSAGLERKRWVPLSERKK